MSCGCGSSSVLPEPPYQGDAVYPPDGVFLLPLCVTAEQTQELINALNFAWGLLSYEDCKNERDALEILLTAFENVNDPLGVPCVDVCEVVAECIETSELTQDALRDFIQANGFNSGTDDWTEHATTTAQRSENLLSGENCDNDELFGACMAIVTQTNRDVTDILERIEVASNNVEIVGIVTDAVENIPQVALLSTLIEWVSWVQDGVKEQYDGAYDASLESDIACALWCQAQDTCSLSLDDIVSVYEGLLGEALPVELDDLVDLFASVLLGTVTGAEAVYALHLIYWGVIRLISRFFGFTTNRLKTAIRAGQQLPDGGWVDCDLCVSCWLLDFATDDYDFVNVDISGTAGNQFVGTYSSGAWRSSSVTYSGTTTVRGVAVERAISSSLITRVEGVVDWQKGVVTSPFALTPFRVVLLNGSTVVFDSGNINGSDEDDTDVTYGFDMSVTANKIRVLALCDAGVSITPTGESVIKAIRVITDDDIGVGVPCGS